MHTPIVVSAAGWWWYDHDRPASECGPLIAFVLLDAEGTGPTFVGIDGRAPSLDHHVEMVAGDIRYAYVGPDPSKAEEVIAASISWDEKADAAIAERRRANGLDS